MALLLGTTLHASNGPVVSSGPQSEIVNQQQNAVDADSRSWLRLATADIGAGEHEQGYAHEHDYEHEHDGDRHKRYCKRRERRGEECRPLKRLRVRPLHKLQFGDMVSSPGGGVRVVIDPVTGSKSVFGSVNLGGKHGPAEFVLKGRPDHRFEVILPREIFLAGKTGPGPRVSGFTAHLTPNRTGSSGNDGGSLIGHFGRDGKAKLIVGGTLYLDSSRQIGRFNAPFDVFVDYLP